MDGGAKIRLGPGHDPAVDNDQIECFEIGVDALLQTLHASRRPKRSDLGHQFPATAPGGFIVGKTGLADMCRKARVAEELLEERISPLPGGANGRCYQPRK